MENKKLKGLLFCSGGYSSSILSARLTELGQEYNLSFDEAGLGSVDMNNIADKYDVVLFAPHLSAYYEDYEDLFEEKGKPFIQVESREYVAINAEILFEKIKKALSL
ncbi:PTS sugar transporter subunit IIB [Mesoplasma florum]|uniref:PTS sugar transporter subunit IIB n=1 Tax=Mesoplasma florum TaxID=2151 RepID=UPI0012FE6758|nr:hypothetical protein [Mesoplasma florum]